MNKKLLRTTVVIEGSDKDILEKVFAKILNGTVELNELKMTAIFLSSVCKSADLQIESD